MHKTRSYITGFIISIVLTVTSFFLVSNHVSSSEFLLEAILILALTQLYVQLTFFLHLGQEKKPSYNFVIFASTAGIVLLIVIGSIWIMNHLNYNMTPTQMENYAIS